MKDKIEVFNTYRRNCHAKMKKVKDFVASHVDASLTSDDFNRLRDLNTALKEQWAHMEVAWDSNLETDPDETLEKLVSDTGKAIDETLEKSWRFAKAKSGATSTTSPALQATLG